MNFAPIAHWRFLEELISQQARGTRHSAAVAHPWRRVYGLPPVASSYLCKLFGERGYCFWLRPKKRPRLVSEQPRSRARAGFFLVTNFALWASSIALIRKRRAALPHVTLRVFPLFWNTLRGDAFSPPCSLAHGTGRAKVSVLREAARRQCELGVFGSRTSGQANLPSALARSACRALRVTVPDGIILDSYGEADTRRDEYPPEVLAGTSRSSGSKSRATEDRTKASVRARRAR